MANRNFASGGKLYSMHVMPVMVTATIQIGATGAVSSFVGSMVQSVVRTGTGLYRITLQPQTNFTRLYFAQGSMQSPVSGLSGTPDVEIQNAPNASVALSAGAQLIVKTLNVSGALADPASGSAVNVMMILSNSSVVIGGE